MLHDVSFRNSMILGMCVVVQGYKQELKEFLCQLDSCSSLVFLINGNKSISREGGVWYLLFELLLGKDNGYAN